MKLAELGIDELMDQALRMAILGRTSGVARQVVQNNRAIHSKWTGLEHWRVPIAQFDPIDTRMAQVERSEVMRGATSKNWIEFEAKLIQWEAKLLRYEKRVAIGERISET